MRAALVLACVLVAVVATTATSRGEEPQLMAGQRLVQSYDPPAGDPVGDRIRERAWTYDSAITATARAVRGDLDGAGALLDVFGAVQRADGALEGSYDLEGNFGAGPLRAGNQAWVGLAALQWRALTCSGRHDRLIAGVARWLLDHRVSDPSSPGYGLVIGGPDVSWASTEHNLEARAFFAGLDATFAGRPVDPVLGRACQPGLDGLDAAAAAALAAEAHDAVERIDRAIDAALYDRSGAYLRQGLDDDVRPLDVQALGILWLLGRGRHAEAEAVERTADAALWVEDRRVDWPGASGQTFAGYRPFAEAASPDVVWLEGTLMMRLAKARLGSDLTRLDDSIDRWVALSAPQPPLQVDRADGEDYHVWPAAAPAAWLALSRGSFALLQQ